MWRIDISTPFDRYTVTATMVSLFLGPVETFQFPLSNLRVLTFTHRDVDTVTVVLDCGVQMSFGGGPGNARNLLDAIVARWDPPKATLLPAEAP